MSTTGTTPGQVACQAWADAHGNPVSFRTWGTLPGQVREAWEKTAAAVLAATHEPADGPVVAAEPPGTRTPGPSPAKAAVAIVAARTATAAEGQESAKSIVLCPTCLHDGVLERTLDRAATAEARLLECMEQVNASRERAEAAEARCAALEGAAQAEAKLAGIRTVLLEGGQDAGTARRRALAVIGTEEERPVVYAALDRAVERVRAAEGEILALRSQLASAQNAIGQLIRWSQSVLMEEGRAERKRFARWLLDELAPWTGQERSEEGERHG
jgi:hypothetical protein